MSAVTIHTTQNVRIDYETGKLGSRLGAFAIDLIAIVLSYLLLILLLELLGAELNGTVTVQLAPVFYIILYFFLWEMLSRGQTAGKMLVKLRVIRLDGEDPTPADFLIRAIFLIPDVIFTLGMMAVFLIATGRQNQRLGDLIARTVVIRTKPVGGVSLGDILTIRSREHHEARYPEVQRMTDEDMLTVKECLLRYRRYRNAAHASALSLLADRMLLLLDLEPAAVQEGSEEFLETLLLDYIVLTR